MRAIESIAPPDESPNGRTPEPPGTIETIFLTPALAAEFLGRNLHNRNLRAKTVDKYVRDIRAGRWIFNGGAIGFDRDGRLIDGQHRCQAVVVAEVGIWIGLVRGLPPEAQETLDTNLVRTAGDAARLRGIEDGKLHVAIARKIAFWQAGYRFHFNNVQWSTSEVLAMIAADKRIGEAADLANRLSRATAISPSTLGLCYWLFSAIDVDQADGFFERLASGADLAAGHPVLTLRNRLVVLRSQASRTPEELILALVIRGWNAYRQGRSLTKISLDAGRDKFPEPK